MAQDLFRKKSLMGIRRAHAAHEAEGANKPGLKKALGFWSLTALGIGCTIGTGIFVMPGFVAADHAGPAMVVSFLLAALASALAAVCYCELSNLVPASGSTYSYAYVAFGELIAWLIGWDLLLEYGLANSAVASGWGGYLNQVLRSFGVEIPVRFLYTPGEVIPGSTELGIFNLPAVLSIAIVTLLLIIGIRESARFNNGLVLAKLGVLVMFVLLCAPHFNPANMTPFMPHGWSGVMSGAALLFFVFVGFDTVSTVAEEAVDPQRNIPRALLTALSLVAVVYVAVGLTLTGVVPLEQLGPAKEPLAHALTMLQQPMAAWILSTVAVIGILSVLITGSIGQTRILYVMSRDGLMPRFMANVNHKTGAPVETTLLLGAITAVLAAAVPLSALADLVSIGTLAAFCMVSAGVIVMRRRAPNVERTFRVPWVPVLPIAGIGINLYLMFSLSAFTWMAFGIWIAIGLVVYFAWSRRSASKVFDPNEEAEPIEPMLTGQGP